MWHCTIAVPNNSSTIICPSSFVNSQQFFCFDYSRLSFFVTLKLISNALIILYSFFFFHAGGRVNISTILIRIICPTWWMQKFCIYGTFKLQIPFRIFCTKNIDRTWSLINAKPFFNPSSEWPHHSLLIWIPFKEMMD